MDRDRPSRTAVWVAAARGLGVLLPADVRLADDPYGLRLAGPAGRALARAAAVAPALSAQLLRWLPPVTHWILYMQLRTRQLDDVLRAFVRAGGRQVLLLGAGFDCRAARFAEALSGAVVYEVDHPATQGRKRALVGPPPAHGPRVVYVPWDFERRETAALTEALAAVGHDRAQPTLTIWEGVTMYLTEPAIEATVATVRALSAPGSPLAFTYFNRALYADRGRAPRIVAQVVRGAGEPFRFGWDPPALHGWLAARGFALEWDRTTSDAAATLLPPAYAAIARDSYRRVALARAR